MSGGKTVSIFVRRELGVFRAATMIAEAVDDSSATIAARRCAAAHFGVAENRITLSPVTDNVLIAGVAVDATPNVWIPILRIAIFCCMAIAIVGAFILGVSLALGGAK